MKVIRSHPFSTLLCFSMAFAIVLSTSAADVKETIQLLPAKNLSAFYSWVDRQGVDKDPNNVFSLKDGVLHVAGTAKGYVATKLEYSNYRLIAEYKWGKAAPDNDSGIFVHCIGPDKAWMTSVEVQLATRADTKSGDVILIGGPTTRLTINGEQKKGGKQSRIGGLDYENQDGGWNTMEILCDGGKVRVSINGKVTLEGTDVEPRAGKIFLQSNKGEILFRKVELHPLK